MWDSRGLQEPQGPVGAALESLSAVTLSPEAGAEDTYPEPYTLV